jgi:arylsulfatase A-like enzyme
MRAMLPTIPWSAERPSFVLLNVGETHYPYAKPDEDASKWPRISGVNGVFKKLEGQIDAEGNLSKTSEAGQFFDQAKLDELRERQIEAVRYLDGVVGELYDTVPKDTYVIVTSDHGELFGESGYFGHGPIMHDKCFEVPYLEGQVR